MRISRDVSARELAGLTDDRLHYGARAVARRVLGSDDPQNVRTVYYWASEVKPELRPKFITKIAGRIAAWESAIRAASISAAAQP